MEKSIESLLTAVNDIKVYADGIERSLRENKREDTRHYINDIRLRLETISEYIES